MQKTKAEIFSVPYIAKIFIDLCLDICGIYEEDEAHLYSHNM